MKANSRPGRRSNRSSVDYSRALGAAALGARLRRLSERIDQEATAVYSRAGLRFEQRWMGALNLLAERGGSSVGELAEALVISHPSVSQTRRSLQEAGFVADRADPLDARRRILYLTDRGIAFVEQLRPVWAALIAAAEDLNHEALDVIPALNRLEDALNRRSLHERAVEKLPTRHSQGDETPGRQTSRGRGR